MTRLDAFTVRDVLELVERSQAPITSGTVVLDQRAASSGPTSGDEWIQRAARRLAAQGNPQRVILETTPKPARNATDVIGYYSWGAADPENRVRNPGMTFARGAIAASLASFDARTFRQPPGEWRPTASAEKIDWFEGTSDTLIGDLIHYGITGVAGQVGEAYLLGAVRPDILFPAYLSGFSLAEAFSLATPTLSWQTVVIGDPLCAPFRRKVLTRTDLEDRIDPRTGLPGSSRPAR